LPARTRGVGNAGFFFALDAAQAANANLLLAANPDLLIGLAANASDATGGLETFSVGAVGGTAVPEPTTITLLGLSLVGLHLVTRKRARR
jgi:PEP-CTERM motif